MNNSVTEQSAGGAESTGEGVGKSFEQDGEQRARLNREELAERIARAVPEDGTVQPLKGLHLIRVSATSGPVVGVAYPSFCVIAQGTKEIYLGETCYRYDPYQYLLATVELPVVIQLGEASKEKPYLSLRLELDPALVASVMLEAGLPSPRSQKGSVRALDVSPLDVNLLEAAVHLVRLAEAPPSEARVLLPLIHARDPLPASGRRSGCAPSAPGPAGRAH